MKILIVTNQKHIGGVNTVIRELAKGLTSLGQKVLIIEGQKKGEFKEREGIRFLNYKIDVGYWRGYFSIFFGVWLNLSKIKKSEFDLIYGHLSFSSLIAFIHPTGKNKLKVFHFHGDHSLELKASILPPRKHKYLGRIKRFFQFAPEIFFEKIILKLCLKKANLIIAPSHWAKNLLRQRYKINQGKIKVLSSPVELNIFNPVTEKRKLILRKKYGFDSKLFILTLATRLEPRKGIEMLLKIAPEIHKKFPETFFILVFPLNNEHEKNYFCELYNKGIDLKILGYSRFLSGFVKKKLAEIYQLSDVVLIPSKTLENLPIVCLEALACGIPVIGTPIGGIPEILRPINEKLLARSASEKNFYQAITQYLQLKPEEKKRIAKEGRNYLENNFESLTISKNFLREFKNAQKKIQNLNTD